MSSTVVYGMCRACGRNITDAEGIEHTLCVGCLTIRDVADGQVEQAKRETLAERACKRCGGIIPRAGRRQYCDDCKRARRAETVARGRKRTAPVRLLGRDGRWYDATVNQARTVKARIKRHRSRWDVRMRWRGSRQSWVVLLDTRQQTHAQARERTRGWRAEELLTPTLSHLYGARTRYVERFDPKTLDYLIERTAAPAPDTVDVIVDRDERSRLLDEAWCEVGTAADHDALFSLMEDLSNAERAEVKPTHIIGRTTRHPNLRTVPDRYLYVSGQGYVKR